MHIKQNTLLDLIMSSGKTCEDNAGKTTILYRLQVDEVGAEFGEITRKQNAGSTSQSATG